MSLLNDLLNHMKAQVLFIEQTLGKLPSVLYINPDLLLMLSREPGFYTHPAFKTEVTRSAPVVSKIQMRRDLAIQIYEDANELFYHFESE